MAFCKLQTKTQAFTVIAAAVLILSACQQRHQPELVKAERQWQVIESVGNIRIENDRSRYAMNLLADQEIAENSRVITGARSHLILSNGDMQLTLRRKSSVTLPTSMSASGLSHHYGSARVRLNSAANATTRITTKHLTASGTNAVLDLHVDDQESLITIASGSVVLSTSNGNHHAQLVAGASARLGAGTNGQLEIRRTADMPFRANRALSATKPDTEPEEPVHTVDIGAMPGNETKAGQEPSALGELAIVPASRRTIKPPAPKSTTAAKTDTQPDSTELAELPAAPSRSVAVAREDKVTPTKLQQQFDNLTRGLLDNLPIAESRVRQDR